MYDLAVRPEVVEDLRKEIKSILKETDGVMTSSALFNMKLLDSVMRESQRFSPPFTGRSITPEQDTLCSSSAVMYCDKH